jgi:hypothetical protein
LKITAYFTLEIEFFFGCFKDKSLADEELLTTLMVNIYACLRALVTIESTQG